MRQRRDKNIKTNTKGDHAQDMTKVFLFTRQYYLCGDSKKVPLVYNLVVRSSNPIPVLFFESSVPALSELSPNCTTTVQLTIGG